MNIPVDQTDSPWWMKYGARGVGMGGGIIAMGLGVFTCISFSAWCMVAGIFQILAGFIVVSAEAPCCCQFVDFVNRYSAWAESRPPWQKSAAYIVLGLPSFVMCFSIAVFFGSGLIILCGIIYGMMALGKKASREEMSANVGPTRPGGMKDILVNSEVPPSMA